jgi:hypothetical protein
MRTTTCKRIPLTKTTFRRNEPPKRGLKPIVGHEVNKKNVRKSKRKKVRTP